MATEAALPLYDSSSDYIELVTQVRLKLRSSTSPCRQYSLALLVRVISCIGSPLPPFPLLSLLSLSWYPRFYSFHFPLSAYLTFCYASVSFFPFSSVCVCVHPSLALLCLRLSLLSPPFAYVFFPLICHTTPPFNLRLYVRACVWPSHFILICPALLQFGYVTMFSAALPIAPLLAYINNLFEFNLDLVKLSECRRPLRLPRSVCV